MKKFEIQTKEYSKTIEAESIFDAVFQWTKGGMRPPIISIMNLDEKNEAGLIRADESEKADSIIQRAEEYSKEFINVLPENIMRMSSLARHQMLRQAIEFSFEYAELFEERKAERSKSSKMNQCE
jgi:hypothetical protein